jgi:uncharacterized protein (DUF2249 family)
LDVRDDLRQGREPFTKILDAVGRLADNQELLLLVPFEPAPLLTLLGSRGFSHSSKPTASGDWAVLFQRNAGAVVPAAPPAQTSVPAPVDSSFHDVDARGLEPPQPLVTILEAVGNLPPGGVLRARTDRRPMHLYPHLQARGFTGDTQEQTDGSFITYIRRA